MAARVNIEPAKLLETLKQTVFKKATNDELIALVIVANEYQLNPFLKEIYAFPAKGGGIVPVVGIDGWIKILNRQPDFDGIEFEFTDDDAGNVYSVTTSIWVKSRSKPVKVIEYMSECYRETEPWKTMPRRMLRHKGLMQASRVAFGFSGIHDEDEAIDVQATIMADEVTTAPKKLPATKPPEQTASTNAILEFEALMEANRFTFDDVIKWGVASGQLENADSIPSIADLKEADVKRWLRNREGLIKSINDAKGAA